MEFRYAASKELAPASVHLRTRFNSADERAFRLVLRTRPPALVRVATRSVGRSPCPAGQTTILAYWLAVGCPAGGDVRR